MWLLIDLTVIPVILLVMCVVGSTSNIPKYAAAFRLLL